MSWFLAGQWAANKAVEAVGGSAGGSSGDGLPVVDLTAFHLPYGAEVSVEITDATLISALDGYKDKQISVLVKISQDEGDGLNFSIMSFWMTFLRAGGGLINMWVALVNPQAYQLAPSENGYTLSVSAT